MKRTVEVGPFALFFTNVNKPMALPGHSHFATLRLVYAHTAPTGFPAFADTYAAIQARIMELTAKPFRDARNEDVAQQMWEAFLDWRFPEADRWEGADYHLVRLELAVRGVPDRIGHADGFTTYAIEEEWR